MHQFTRKTAQLIFAVLCFSSAVSHADLFDDRANAAASRIIRSDMAKADAFLYKENSGALRRVRGFIARHGGATVASCSVELMRCQPDENSFDCFPQFKEQTLDVNAIDPRAMALVQSCRLELADGLACQTDRDNKAATCYDSSARSRTFRM